MPASVSYFVDLKSVKKEDINYAPYAKVLFIKLPPVQASPVTFNMEQARQENGGLLTLSDSVRQQLSKIDYTNANASFSQLASDQGRLNAARAEAQKTVSALLEIPLKATGNGGISVRAY